MKNWRFFLSHQDRWIIFSFITDKCTFEVSFCSWINGDSSEIKWQRISGKTPSPNTGPTFGSGNYLFFKKKNLNFTPFLNKYFELLMTYIQTKAWWLISFYLQRRCQEPGKHLRCRAFQKQLMLKALHLRFSLGVLYASDLLFLFYRVQVFIYIWRLLVMLMVTVLIYLVV